MTTDNKSMTQAEKLLALAWPYTEWHDVGIPFKEYSFVEDTLSVWATDDDRVLDLFLTEDLRTLIRGLILAKGWMPEGWVAKLYYLGNILQQITGTEIDEPRGTSHTLTLEHFFLCRALTSPDPIGYLGEVFLTNEQEKQNG